MILALAILALASQQPSPQGLAVAELENGLRLRVDEIPSASHVCVLLGVRTGDRHMPTVGRGMVELYAAAMDATLLRASDRQAEVQVRGTTLLVLQTVPVVALPEVLAGLRDLLAGPLPLDRDGFALARARARLAADDATQVFPGLILGDRARRLLLPERYPATPRPEEISDLSRSDFERWQRQRLRSDSSFVFILGGISRSAGENLIGEYFAGLPMRFPVAAALAEHSIGRQRPDPPKNSSHRQVLAPFVTLAVPAPRGGSPDGLAFAVGMAVLAGRAAFEFETYRAGEARAGFPFLDYNLAQQGDVALINRRGFNGDETAEVVAEIRSLIEPVLEYGLGRAEVQRAAKGLAAGLRLPPYSRATQQQMRRLWRWLYTKALVLAAYELSAWPRDLCERLESVQVADVNRVLRRQLAPDRSLWLSLEPAARPEHPVSAGQARSL